MILGPRSISARSDNDTARTISPLSVLITEVMFDPEPAVILPPYEYLELYNNSNDTLNLEGWLLRVGDKKVILPACSFCPGGFVLLAKTDALDDFERKGLDILPIDKWPLLRNSGQFIALLSPAGDIVHWMTYHPSQYDDALKIEGGWSLELIDFLNPCHKGAWLPSVNMAGGTPGMENSVRGETGIPLPPAPVRAGILDRNSLFVILSRPVLPLSIPGWFSFSISPEGLSVESWSYYDDCPWMLNVILNDSMPRHKMFTMTVGGEAVDHAGSGLVGGSVYFGLPEASDSGDIVISEIMYDPLDDHPEFLCLHNVSGKIHDLSSLHIAQCDEEGNISRFSKPGDQSFLLFPGEENVMTGDEYILSSKDLRIPSGRIYGREDLPALSNQGSIICLLNESQGLVEKVRYDPGWHDPRIGETKGISLERIRLDISGWFSSNWHSASALYGGSTPGMVNSQAASIHDNEKTFSLENRAFCPDADGYGDYLLVTISALETGWMGSAGIWDLSGRCVRQLSEPGVLPTHGVIKWDGNDDLGNRVSPGYYVVILNYIRPDGSKGRWKEACVVIGF